MQPAKRSIAFKSMQPSHSSSLTAFSSHCEKLLFWQGGLRGVLAIKPALIDGCNNHLQSIQLVLG
jgi:hypothetical protein